MVGLSEAVMWCMHTRARLLPTRLHAADSFLFEMMWRGSSQPFDQLSPIPPTAQASTAENACPRERAGLLQLWKNANVRR